MLVFCDFRDNKSRNILLENRNIVALFVRKLKQLSIVFGISPKVVNIFYEHDGHKIAFNRGGSIFCNFKIFLDQYTQNTKQSQQILFWWVTICHELAHNLDDTHSSVHSFYTESFVQHYYEPVLALLKDSDDFAW